MQLHRAGELNEAEIIYSRILELAPDYADALHFLGILRLYRGREDEAIALVSRSIGSILPRPTGTAISGTCCSLRSVAPESIEAYKRASPDPTHAPALTNLGAVLALEGRTEEAAVAHSRRWRPIPVRREFTTITATCLPVWGASGRGSITTARRSRSGATILTRGCSWRSLTLAWDTWMRLPRCSREWLGDQPDHPIAKHLLAACSGIDIPERASDAYVEKSFDEFADTFDARLSILEYRAPNLIADALRRACGEPKKTLVALDAGCGTGLCGLLVASHCSRLVGVDLSQRMLYKARGRGVYDELVKSELTDFLEQNTSARCRAFGRHAGLLRGARSVSRCFWCAQGRGDSVVHAGSRFGRGSASRIQAQSAWALQPQ